MFTVELLPQAEYRWLGDNPSEKTFPREEGLFPLYHQWRTYCSEAAIIVNTHTTGTGKTKAALLRLLKRVQGKKMLSPQQDDVLLIAPTNELLQQHADDAREFCRINDLPYRVVPITKDRLREYKNQPGFSEASVRTSAAFHYLLNNPSMLKHDRENRATIYVVNPDIFYYAIYYCYNPFDSAALANDVLNRFNYVIVDEFHYYDAKQLASFLFYMKLSHHYHYIESARKKRQFCILTATPQAQVEQYLNNLGVPIEWIRPGEIAPDDQALVEPLQALAPVHLHISNTEELQEKHGIGGLLNLIRQQQATIKRWLLQEPVQDGAIISSSLGLISNIHAALCKEIPTDLIGRVTGSQSKTDRDVARFKRLILASPTVDIGYNFVRAEKKKRQNIDFLFFDAACDDEFIQRLGRAARVLAAEQKDYPSTVWAVIDPTSYRGLQEIAGMTVSREHLGELVRCMPRKHDLYAYLKTGAILELFRPVLGFRKGLSLEEQSTMDMFLEDMHQLFTSPVEPALKPWQYSQMKRLLDAFSQSQKHYGRQRIFPAEIFEYLPQVLQGRLQQAQIPWQHPEAEQGMALICQRWMDARSKVSAEVRGSVQVACRWLQDDLRNYFKEQARFSFRDGFQPPLALIADPQKLHSDQRVSTYNALHIIRYYHARYYETLQEWKQATGESRSNGTSMADSDQEIVAGTDVQVYCHLSKLRPQPLRLHLLLDARDETQDSWEERCAYRVTALHGLNVTTDDDHGLDESMRTLFQAQFVPAFVTSADASSHTMRALHRLHQKARILTLPLTIMFGDGREVNYQAVLGTMAFHVYAGIPAWAMRKDRRKTQQDDDELLLC
ncbi:type I-D CRISPR-associated helicase Cas3' [Dictyobacter arantiisoli]|uniref:Helicase ATP-binding domain-containing protein n=1 Tax=Dictyobacter arantiisoli TaxID=2014874 RepID=A0A5A5TF63_9CHLR|nr:type I-D CRISPR-associated helicase Cas3' [Dictyobacter arantiisoli]GCF10210.1 hypothetical protein KDI_37740 [Dictyobacter arantiisoli]